MKINLKIKIKTKKTILVVLIILVIINILFYPNLIYFNNNKKMVTDLINKNIDTFTDELSKSYVTVNNCQKEISSTFFKDKTISGNLFFANYISDIDEYAKPIENLNYKITQKSNDDEMLISTDFLYNELDPLHIDIQMNNKTNKIRLTSKEIDDFNAILELLSPEEISQNISSNNKEETTNFDDYPEEYTIEDFLSEILLPISQKMATDETYITDYIISEKINFYLKKLYEELLNTSSNVQITRSVFNKSKTVIIVDNKEAKQIIANFIQKIAEDEDLNELAKDKIFYGGYSFKETIDTIVQALLSLEEETEDEIYYMLTINTNIFGSITEQSISFLNNNQFEQYGYSLSKNNVQLYSQNNFNTDDKGNSKTTIDISYAKNSNNLYDGIIKCSKPNDVYEEYGFFDVGFVNNYFNGVVSLPINDYYQISIESLAENKSFYFTLYNNKSPLIEFNFHIEDNVDNSFTSIDSCDNEDYVYVKTDEELINYVNNIKLQKYLDSIDPNFSYYIGNLYNDYIYNNLSEEHNALKKDLMEMYSQLFS